MRKPKKRASLNLDKMFRALKKRDYIRFTVLLIAVLAAAVWSYFDSGGKDFQATVIQVADGDTMTVRTANFEEIIIRLYGIDAPESNQKGGAEARAALAAIHGSQVTIIEMDVDQYGRTVGLVEFEGRSINLDLVTQGLAWYYGQYCQAQPICGHIKAAEKEARTANRGLWAAEKPVPPWEWRRR
jgi:endonuclease YncB( thermonuclease family)